MKLLIPFIVLLFIVLGCSGGNSARKNTQPTAKPADEPFPRSLSADVSLSAAGIVVKNTDSVDLPSMSLKLNLTQWGGDDGRADFGSLPKGKTVTIPYSEITTGTTRFNIRKTKILTIRLKSSDGSSKLFLCPGTKCQPSH